MLLWIWNFTFSTHYWGSAGCRVRIRLSPYVVKFIAMACQFGWGYPLCKYVISVTHSNCSLSFAFAYLYLERLSEEQHRNTCSEAHEQNRCQEELASIGFLPLEAMALKFTLMPSTAISDAEHDVPRSRAAG